MSHEGTYPPTPFMVEDIISSLCSTGHTPYILTGEILRLCIQQWSDPERNVWNHKLKAEGLQWASSPTETQILIEPVWKYSVQAIQKRPAIYVKRNNMRMQRRGIADGGLAVIREDVFKSRHRYSVQVVGSHSLFCVGSTGGEAEAIASEVWRHQLQFSPLIRRDLKLHDYLVAELGTINKLEESHEHFVVPIAITWVFYETWFLTKEGPPLKTVELNMEGDG